MRLGLNRDMSSQCGEHLYVISTSTKACRSNRPYTMLRMMDELTDQQRDEQMDGRIVRLQYASLWGHKMDL